MNEVVLAGLIYLRMTTICEVSEDDNVFFEFIKRGKLFTSLTNTIVPINNFLQNVKTKPMTEILTE